MLADSLFINTSTQSAVCLLLQSDTPINSKHSNNVILMNLDSSDAGSPDSDSLSTWRPHRALLITFRGSHLTQATGNLGVAMSAMGWAVTQCTLNNTNSAKAQEGLEKAVDELIEKGSDFSSQGIIVYYAGYGLQKLTPESKQRSGP